MDAKEPFLPEILNYIKHQVIDGKALLVSNKSYKVHIQKGSNLLAQGMTEIYNKFENVSERITDNCFVITGSVGGQWCIGEKNLKKYGVTADEIPSEGLTVTTKADGIKFLAVHMPLNMAGYVKTSWGNLMFNVKQGRFGETPHGDGDWIIIRVGEDNKIDYNSCDARVVNGTVFDMMYGVVACSTSKQSAANLDTNKGEQL